MTWKEIEDNNRGTGRTTRMLKEAIRLFNEDRAVYVVAANQSERSRLFVELNRLGYVGGKLNISSFIKMETPGSIGRIQWESLKKEGMHPNCVVLFDHHTISSRFGAMLDMLHRFDDDTVKP